MVLSYLVLIGVAEVEREPSRSPEIVCAAPKPETVSFASVVGAGS